MAIEPHGGELVNRLLAGAERTAALDRAKKLAKLKISSFTAFDIDATAKGVLSPLKGFMNKEQTRSVMDNMRLRPGVAWTIPILLPVSQEEGDKLAVGSQVAIEDDTGELAAVLHLSEKFSLDKKEFAQKIYGTADEAHPGVKRVYDSGPVYLAGDLDVLKERKVDHQEYNLPPSATRKVFEEKKWKRIVAFQTRNPIHRAHEYLTKSALEMCDGLLIHPLMGTTKSDDIPGDVRMQCYNALIANYYAKDRTMLSIMPVNMHYAGPREAVMHAIYRQNYGVTHFIVGRDHAGVGNYYGTYDAHFIFDKLEPGSLKIQPLFFENSFFCKACGKMASIKTCPHDKENHVNLSGTKVREMLNAGQEPPVEFSRHEVAQVLIKWATNAK